MSALPVLENTFDGRDCLNCPGHVETFTPGKGKRKARIALVYDTANRSSHPPKLIRAALKALGVGEHEIYQTSAVPCKYGGTTKKSVPIAAWRSCRDGLLNELANVQPEKIIALGSAATAALLGTKAVNLAKTRGRGYTLTLPGGHKCFMVPTFSPQRIMADSELFRDFAYDMHKAVSQSEPKAEPRVDLQVPRTAEAAIELIDLLEGASKVSFDLETTGTKTYKDTTISFGLGALLEDDPDYDALAAVLPKEVYRVPKVKARIQRFFKEYEGVVVTHNGPQFDYPIISREMGKRVRPRKPADTMLMNYALDERPSGGEREEGSNRSSQVQGHALKTLSRVRYDAKDYHFDFAAFYALPDEEKPWDKLYAYHGLDLVYTLWLHDDLEKEMFEESPRLKAVVDHISVPAGFAFGEIEQYGARINVPYFKNLQEELQKQIDGEADYLKKTGTVYLGSMVKLKKVFNPGAPLQVAKVIYDYFRFKPVSTVTSGSKVMQGKSSRTTERLALFTHKRNAQRAIEAIKEGKPFDRLLTGTKTTFEVDAEIARLEAFIAWLDVYLGWKQRTKAKATYVDAALNRVDENGRVHPDILLTGTSTGRTSYRGFNLQNIPALTRTTTVMGKKVRDGFQSDEDTVLVEADFSQAELRTSAWLSNDDRLMETYRLGKDFHTTAASAVFKKPEEEILGYERHAGKFVVFGIIYGRGAQSLCSGWEMDYLEEKGGKRWTVPEAQKFLDAFLDGFPGFKAWQKAQHENVRKLGLIETLTGRRRRVPFIPHRSALSDAERRAVNMPIQGLTSELCLLAVIRVHNALDPTKARITHTVHDSINIECKKSYLEECIRIVNEVMPPKELRDIIPDAPAGEPIPVPFTIDIKTGTQWGSMGDYSKKVAA